MRIIPSEFCAKIEVRQFAKTTFLATALISSSAMFQGCVGTTTSSSSTSSATGYITYKYNTNRFPLSLKVDDTLSATDLSEINDIANDWKESADDAYTFFSVTSDTLGHSTNYSSWKNSSPSVLITNYTNNWPSGLSGFALAVTVNYGFFRVGGLIELTSGSIGINDYNYNFYNETDISTKDSGEYSRQYVVAHEMGHILGLQHVANCSTSSLMEAYVSAGVATTTLNPLSSYSEHFDDCSKAQILGIYGLPMDTNLTDIYNDIVSNLTGNIMAGLTPQALEEAKVAVGDEVIIAHELNPDGSCVHTVNGHKFLEHQVDISKLRGTDKI